MLLVDEKQVAVADKSPHYTVGKAIDDIGYIRHGRIVASFDGVNSALGYVKKHMPTSRLHKASSKRIERNFTVFSYNDALDTFEHRPETIRQFSEKDITLGGGDSDGLQVNYDVTGDFIDIDRVIAGQPDSFGSMTDGKPRGRRVYIMVAINWRYDVSHTVINERSKRILRLVDWLECQGVRTNVIAIDSNDQVHVEIAVKRFGDPLNLNDLAIVNHSDWLRRIGFRIREYGSSLDSGYGTPSYLTERMREFKPSELPDFDPNALYIYIGNNPDSYISSEFSNLEMRLQDALDHNQEHHELQLKQLEESGNFLRCLI